MTERVLITGGAGFIGSHLVDRALQSGLEVVILDDFSTGRRESIPSHPKILDVHEYDLRSSRDKKAGLSLEDIFAKHEFSVVYHLAAISSVPYCQENPDDSHQVNVEGTLNLLHACDNHDVGRFVYTSSAAVYGNQEGAVAEYLGPMPINEYGSQKRKGEEVALAFGKQEGLEVVALRPFNVYGPRQNPDSGYAALIPNTISRLASNNPPIIYGDGEQTRDFVHVSDVVRAFLMAGMSGRKCGMGKAYNVGTGKGKSVNEIVDSLVLASGKELEPVHEPKRAGDIRHSRADISKIRDMFHWSPGVVLEKGLRNTYESYQK